MKRNYCSPKRKFKPDPSARRITEFFKTPPKNDVDNSSTISPSLTSKANLEESSQQRMKQLSLSEMSQKKRADEATTSNCRRKLELVPVIEKLSDLIVKHKLENCVNSSHTLQSSDRDNNAKNGSDDELPECLSQSDSSPSKSTTSNFIRRKYKFDISHILEERERKKESNELLKQMEDELRNGDIQSDGQSDDLEEFKSYQNLKYNIKNDIKQEPPGIELFNLSKCFNLYTIARPPTRPENIIKSEFDKGFDKLISSYSIRRFITLVRLSRFPLLLHERPWVLSYIFHVMSSDTDNQLTDSCYEILAAVNKISKETKTLNWKPTVLDLVAVLANHGADVQRLIADYNIQYHEMLKEKYSNEPKIKSENDDQLTSTTTFMNLSLVFQTLTLYVQLPDSYSDEERVFMLFAAISVSLDKVVNDVFLIEKIRSFVEVIISSFSQHFWMNGLTQLVENLLTISEHHHDRVFIVRLMPYISRGHRLQQLLSFGALVQLLEIEWNEDMFKVQMDSVLTVCNKTTLNSLNDSYKLHSALELINAYVTPELENCSMTQETLEILKSVLRDVNSKLIDRIYDWDVTIVKNVITQMMGRLSLLKNTLPSNQKTLFQYEKIVPEPEEIVTSQECDSDEIADPELPGVCYDD